MKPAAKVGMSGMILGTVAAAGAPLCISGVYPHLAVFSHSGEVGIGAVVPWADRLWMITYPPHARTGSDDKLYEIDEALNVTVRPESVGGTHADRMIHRESGQLIIGPYFIDAERHVRAADVRQLVGRLTGAARHLADPANKVLFYDMEGAVYEVDVHSLAVTKRFDRPVPGWHGKGAYTGQGRFIVANNGEVPGGGGKRDAQYLAGAEPEGPEEAGVLAEWDGKHWRIVERRQFTEVTGPGGIYGSSDDTSPVWAVGWDKRSVILKVLAGGAWSTFRLPKASHAYDPRHGWYTEWPRIREVTGGHYLMDMHGLFYDFPPGFGTGHTDGLTPVASHLRYLPDFCGWKGRLVLASDDTSIMKNPMAGQSQSNLWFGRWEDLPHFGPAAGWGGPWLRDPVTPDKPSTPFLVRGFARTVLHLAGDAKSDVVFTIEVDRKGDGQWEPLKTVTVGPKTGYAFVCFPRGIDAAWARLHVDRACRATAFFHLASPRPMDDAADDLFAALPAAGAPDAYDAGLIRPAGHNRNLQFVARRVAADGSVADAGYREVDAGLAFETPGEDRTAEVEKVAAIRADFSVDAASVIMTRKGKHYRLPKGDPAYDQPFPDGWPRGIRECESERYLVNVHGSFYELPRDDGLPYLKPVCTHNRRIMDFCTWRGLLVLSGTRRDAAPDGHLFRAADGPGLWFGAIDDLWRLGKPAGHGGPWRETTVEAGEPSDPYLMTGYDRKTLELSHDAADPVTIRVEVDFVADGTWHPYASFTVPPGETFRHAFPEAYSAHWIRFTADRPCRATAWLVYE